MVVGRPPLTGVYPGAPGLPPCAYFPAVSVSSGDLWSVLIADHTIGRGCFIIPITII